MINDDDDVNVVCDAMMMILVVLMILILLTKQKHLCGVDNESMTLYVFEFMKTTTTIVISYLLLSSF